MKQQPEDSEPSMHMALSMHMAHLTKTTGATPIAERHLFMQEGTSDKEYHIIVAEGPGGGSYVVHFAYGRRGKNLTTGVKYGGPSRAEALDVFHNIVNEKLRKGYRDTSEPDAPKVDDPKLVAEKLGTLKNRCVKVTTPKTTIYYPALLKEMSIDEAEGIISDPDEVAKWVMQEKLDGERRMIYRTTTGVIGFNKRGEKTTLPLEVIEEAEVFMPEGTMLDGELIRNVLYAFDCLWLDGVDIRTLPLVDRLFALETGAIQFEPDMEHLLIVPTYEHEDDIARMFEQLQKDNAEGVVLKKKDGTYKAGRNDEQRKVKFWATATTVCIEKTKADGKHSVAVAVLSHGALRRVGQVTLPPSHPVPPVGSYLEVKYLYLGAGDSLYQPSLMRVRSDAGMVDVEQFDNLKRSK